MALGEVQAALARLFTDENARATFFRDPRIGGRALGLDEKDAATLAGLAPQAIGQFARSLKAKRMLDLRKAMPLTALALGEAFADHFRGATSSSHQGADRLTDAKALAARLVALAKTREASPAWIGELAHYEAAFIEAAKRPFGLRILALKYPIGHIAASLYAGAPVGAVARFATFALWARRPGGRLLHRVWSLRR
jgi:hypothetical protein